MSSTDAAVGALPSDAESVAVGHDSVPGFRDIDSVLRCAPVLRYFTVPALRRARSLDWLSVGEWVADVAMVQS